MNFGKRIQKSNLTFIYLNEKRMFIWDYRWQFLVIQTVKRLFQALKEFGYQKNPIIFAF